MRANKIELRENKLTLTLVDHPDMSVQDCMEHLNNGKLIEVTIKKWRKKKSVNSNSLMWAICYKIGTKIGSSKEDVYKKVVREMGPFWEIPIKNEEADLFRIVWKGKGLGWFTEIADKDEKETHFLAYYGSSLYDSRQMSLLIDSLMEEANTLGVDTLSPQDRTMVESYGKSQNF